MHRKSKTSSLAASRKGEDGEELGKGTIEEAIATDEEVQQPDSSIESIYS